MQRNASLELFRIVMMLGICWLHCSQQGGLFQETRWIYRDMRPCVVGFVFLTGYFGMSFKLSKAFKLTGVCLWCALISVLLRNIASGSALGMSVVWDVGSSFVNGYWFFWAYLALMIISPILNAATDNENRVVCVAPFLFLIFVWSYLCVIPGVSDCVPDVEGLGALSVLTLAAVYCSARLFRNEDVETRFNRKLWLIAVPSVAMCALGFSHYNSPFALMAVCCGFVLFKNVMLPKLLSRVVLAISPSVFAVYILHQTAYGYPFVDLGMRIARKVSSCPATVTFIAAVIVFCICVGVDMIRRSLLKAVRRLYV